MLRSDVLKLIPAIPPLPTGYTIGGWWRRGEPEGHSLSILVPHNGWLDELQDLPLNIESLGRTVPMRGEKFIINNMQVSFHPYEDEYFGAALLHITGNLVFDMLIRGIAKQKGLSLSQYGLFDHKERIAGADEYQIFYALDLEYVPPEERNVPNIGYKFVENTSTILKRR